MQTCAELAALIETTNAELQAAIAERTILDNEISALETTLMSLWMMFWYQCSGGGALVAATKPPGDPDSELAQRAKRLVEQLRRLVMLK